MRKAYENRGASTPPAVKLPTPQILDIFTKIQFYKVFYTFGPLSVQGGCRQTLKQGCICDESVPERWGNIKD